MKRTVSVLLAFILLWVVTAPPQAAASFIFTALDLDVLPFKEPYFPRYGNNGSLLISSVVLKAAFSSQLIPYWDADEQNYTLLYSNRILTFAYGRGTAFSASTSYIAEMQIADIGGETVFYMPIDLLCTHFGWDYSLLDVDWGVMLRFASQTPSVSNNDFYDIFSRRIEDEFLAYLESTKPKPIVTPPDLSPSSTPAPTSPSNTAKPLPTTTPSITTPSSTPSGIVKPTEKPVITPTPEPSPTPEPMKLYLTFEGALDDTLTELDTFLTEHQLPAVFFLETNSLANLPDELRRLSSRYAIGLMPDDEESAYFDNLEQANDNLAALVFRKTLLYRLMGDIPEEDAVLLEEKGYQMWGENLRLDSSMTSDEMWEYLSALPTQSTQVVSMPICPQIFTVLNTLVQQIQDNAAIVYAFEAGAKPIVNP